MDSSDIYDDLNDASIGDKLIKAEQENKKLLQHIEVLKGDIAKLCNELTQMKSKESNLKRNISELFNTALMEIDRKQRSITDLQSQLDDLRFKRSNYYNSNKRSRDDDIELIEPKKLKTDSSSRGSSDSKKTSDRSHKEKYDRNKSDNRSTSRSGESHKHSSSKSKTDSREPEEKNSHNSKPKVNNNCYGTDIRIEIKNNERMVNRDKEQNKGIERHTKNDDHLKKDTNNHRKDTKTDDRTKTNSKRKESDIKNKGLKIHEKPKEASDDKNKAKRDSTKSSKLEDASGKVKEVVCKRKSEEKEETIPSVQKIKIEEDDSKSNGDCDELRKTTCRTPSIKVEVENLDLIKIEPKNEDVDNLPILVKTEIEATVKNLDEVLPEIKEIKIENSNPHFIGIKTDSTSSRRRRCVIKIVN